MTRRGLPVGPPPPQEELVDLPLDPPLAESPFLRPKRRTRVRPRRRGLSAGLVLGLQVLAVGLLAVGGAWTAWQRVFASERLRVGRLDVRGNHFLSEGEVRELIGPAVGENILALDIEALKARLRASPWVADATVTRTLPDLLRVEIRERVPLALAELDHLYLMDSEGGLIDMYGPATGAFDLPIVRGLRGLEDESRRERARLAGTLLADLAELGSELSEVYVLPSGDLRVVLRGAGEVLLFGEPPYRERLVTFLSLRKDLVERAPDAEHFDLRYKGRIYAKRPGLPAHPSQPTAVVPPLPTALGAREPVPASVAPAGAPQAMADQARATYASPSRTVVVARAARPDPPLAAPTRRAEQPQAARAAGFTPAERAGGLGESKQRAEQPQAARAAGFTPAERAGGLGGATQRPPEEN